MPAAKDGEVTIVQVESDGYKDATVTVPICAMKGGADLQKYIDVLLPSPPATLKIVRGEGPIHLVGSHCVDYYGFKDEEDTASKKAKTDATPSKDDSKTTPAKEGSAKKK